MLPALGAGGRGFDSPITPFCDAHDMATQERETFYQASKHNLPNQITLPHM